MEDIAEILRTGYDISRLTDFMDKIIDKYELDVIFLDTHPGIEQDVLLSFVVSDILLIVLRMDEQDILGTGIVIEVAKRLKISKIFLLLSMVPRSYSLEDVKKEIEKTFNVKVIGVLPFSMDIFADGSREIFYNIRRDSEFCKELEKIGMKLMKELTR